MCSGLMVSALEIGFSGPDLKPDRGMRFALFCWAIQFSLTVPLSTQVYTFVPATLILGVTLQCFGIPSRGKGVEILPAANETRDTPFGLEDRP